MEVMSSVASTNVNDADTMFFTRASIGCTTSLKSDTCVSPFSQDHKLTSFRDNYVSNVACHLQTKVISDGLVSCSVGKETGPSPSFIAHILGGSDGDLAEGSICSATALFDDYESTSSETPGCSFSPNDTWTAHHDDHSYLLSQTVVSCLSPAVVRCEVSHSLLVCSNSIEISTLKYNIGQVVCDHELTTCTPSDALKLANKCHFQLVWLLLSYPPTESLLAAASGIRYSSEYNKKTIQIGVCRTRQQTDLNLHGIDEILLKPVSKQTIRQKYFNWTSVKLCPECQMGSVQELSKVITPNTPDSSIGNESSRDLSHSSLTSDTANDSNMHTEVVRVDKRTSASYLVSLITSSSACPSRERIKDSCDQLRVLLPYVRGRKTDMASILEMTVDYLKIVNSQFPHEFHAHVLEIMTLGDNASSQSSLVSVHDSAVRKIGQSQSNDCSSSSRPKRRLQRSPVSSPALMDKWHCPSVGQPIAASAMNENDAHITKRKVKSCLKTKLVATTNPLYMESNNRGAPARNLTDNASVGMSTFLGFPSTSAYNTPHYALTFSQHNPFSHSAFTLSSSCCTNLSGSYALLAPSPSPVLSSSGFHPLNPLSSRFYPSTHLDVDTLPSFLSQSHHLHPRFSYSLDKDAEMQPDNTIFCNTASPYYHFLPEFSSMYTMASGTGAPLYGDMITGSGTPHLNLSMNSAFMSRVPVATPALPSVLTKIEFLSHPTSDVGAKH